MIQWKYLCVFALAISLFSCGEKELARATYEFPEGYTWNKSDTVELKLNVQHNAEPCELFLDVRYATFLPAADLNLKLIEVNPQGERISRDLSIPIRNAKGEFEGDVSGDIGDITRELESVKQFPTHGTYTYKLVYTMPVNPLVGIMEFRIRATEKEKKK